MIVFKCKDTKLRTSYTCVSPKNMQPSKAGLQRLIKSLNIEQLIWPYRLNTAQFATGASAGRGKACQCETKLVSNWNTQNHRVKIQIEFSLSYALLFTPPMLSFVDNFEGINHRYFNRKQYRYLHLIPRKLNQFLNRVKALCLLCGVNVSNLLGSRPLQNIRSLCSTLYNCDHLSCPSAAFQSERNCNINVTSF